MDVSKNKDDTKKVQLFEFPSLHSDIYQENILKNIKLLNGLWQKEMKY